MKHGHSSDVRHRHDTNTCNYTKLCDFFKLLAVSACQCSCRVRCPHPCFIHYSAKFLFGQQIYCTICKNRNGEGKERIRTTLTKFSSVPLNIPAPPDAKLTPSKNNDTFFLLKLILDIKER